MMTLVGIVLFAGLVSGCGGTPAPSERPDPAQMIHDGSWYVREQWPHDGQPHETEHFIVYSDGAGLEARKRLGALAEKVLVEVLDEMGVDPETMFHFPTAQDKIDLYANRYNPLEGGGARAYYAGIIIPSFDHQASSEDTDVRAVRATLSHEMVHVVEALLKGRFVGDLAVSDPRRMPVWFSEGTAEALSGGTSNGAPRTLDEMKALILEFGRINPIGWKVDLPLSELAPGIYPNYYYPMAHLAVEYLLDADGLGKTPHDLAAVMLDMGKDESFASAFETHMGISQSEYESQFFALMDAYLPQSQSPIKAVGLGLLSLLIAGLFGVLVKTSQPRPVVLPVAGVVDVPANRRDEKGFLAGISMAAVVAVGFTTLLLYRIAFADLPPYVGRAPGYLTTAVYVVASASILMWVIRRWANRPRGAYLALASIIAVTAITTVVIGMMF